MYENKFNFIITGAMGSGKSSLIAALKAKGYQTESEPAREILAEQRLIEGDGVYDRNPQLFCDLMLSRAIYKYVAHQDDTAPVFSDRGIADNIAYMNWFGFSDQIVRNAADAYRYNSQVFFIPSWEAIYETDDERTMSFGQAHAFGEQIKEIYESIDYTLIEVPKVSIEERIAFIEQAVKQQLESQD